ncbi:MAG TPA: tyrosine-type recombinase/integrase, partial [Nitrososphaeraceae archaeon]
MQIIEAAKKEDSNQRKEEEENNNRLYTNFIYSIKTEVTRELYLKFMRYYMKFLGIKKYSELIVDKPQKIIESDIKAYLVYLRNEKKISYKSAELYLTAIKKFYYVNSDYQFKWNLIDTYLGNDDIIEITDNDDYSTTKDLPEEEEEDSDRPYTRVEIQKMLNSAQDIRVKVIIAVLSSSGLRHGAINLLKLRDLKKIEKYNIYQITAYRTSKKFRYPTFTTPEAANLIDSYLEYRKNHGEVLKGNSPLIREQFSTIDKLKANNPKHLTTKAIRHMVNEVLTKYSGLRKKLEFDYENNRKIGKNQTMLTHGFRKFFHTECAKAGVYPDFIELMLGHKLPGVRSHYMKPDINTLLEGTKECKGYVAAIDSLTINDENRLQKQIQQLEEQDNYNKYIIDKKIKEKDEQIKFLMSKVEKLSEKEQEFIEIQ